MAQTIKLKRSSTSGKVPTTSQLALGEIAINTNDGRVFFEKNDGSATIQHIVTTDSITTGSIQLSDNDGTSAGSKVVLGSGTGSLQIVGDSANDNFFIFNKTALVGGQSQTLHINSPTIKIGEADPDTTERGTNVNIGPTNLKFTNLSAQNSEATALMINGSNVVGTRELGSNAFTSTTIGTTSNALTDGTGIADFSFDGSGTATISTDDSAIVHDNLSGFVANEHIDHSGVSITAGTGLNGGGTIVSTRTLNVDSDYKNTSLNSFTASNANTSLNAATGSYLTTVDISDDTNLAGGTGITLTGDTLSTTDSEIVHDNLSGFVANEHIDHSSVSITAGTGLNGGGTIASTRTLNVDDDYKNTSLNTFTASNANTSLNTFTASNANTSLNAATGSYLTAHPNISAGSDISQDNSNGTVLQDLDIQLDSNGHVTTATAGTVNLDGRYYTETESDTLFTKKLGQGVVSGSDQIATTFAQTILDDADAAAVRTTLGVDAAGTVNYTLPTNLAGDDIDVDTGALTGATVISDLDFNITTNTSGLVTDANGSVSTRTLTAANLSLGNVTNESKATMFTDPTFTGTTAAPTPSSNDNSTKIATTAYVQTELTDLVGNAPAAFDTLGEISASLAADSGALDSLTTVVAGKLAKTSNLSDLSNASTARSNLGVDAAGTDNSTNVTLAGTPNYITISGQEITRNTIDIGDDTNLAVSDTSEVNMILSGDTLSAELIGGVVSGSSQISLETVTGGSGIQSGSITNSDLAGSIANSKLSNSSVSFGGVSVALGASDATPAFDLSDATGYLTSELDGTITNSQLAGSIANGKLANSAITISGTSVSLGGSITDETLFGGVGVVTGSAQLTSAFEQVGSGIISGAAQISGLTLEDIILNQGSGNVELDSFIFHQGDTNTNFGFNGNDVFKVNTNNTEKIFANSNAAGLKYAGNNRVVTTSAGGDLTGDFTVYSGGSIIAATTGGSITGFSITGSIAATNGVVSGSSQIDGSSISNKSVSFGGVSVNLGSSDSTPAFNLADATGYQTSNLSGTITNSQLAGSIANGKLANSAITISGTSVSLGSSITDETLFGGTGVISGSTQLQSNFLRPAQNLDDVDSVSDARDNLGLGSLATLSSIDISSNTNLAVSDTSEVNMILTGDTISAELIGGVVSGSSQVSIGSTTGTLAVNKGGTGATDAAGARTNLGVDAAGTDNSTNVSLSGTPDYITISGQTITRNQIDLTADVTGVLPSANLDSDTAHLSGTQTFSGAKTFSSEATFTAGIQLNDSDTIKLGTGADFIIEDDGSDTLFKSTRHGGEVYFQNENGSGTNQNTLILGTDTGNTSATYAELRYNNVERIKTTSGGSDMAGTVNFNGTTQSTSKTSGTVVIDGGVGIAKTLNVGEDVVAYASSDERYKDLITPIENPNEKIKLLSGNTFVWNDKHEVFKGKKDIGVIAQEVEKVLPEIVETRDNGYKAVKYEKIVALLIESNKELIKRVEELESKIK